MISISNLSDSFSLHQNGFESWSMIRSTLNNRLVRWLSVALKDPSLLAKRFCHFDVPHKSTKWRTKTIFISMAFQWNSGKIPGNLQNYRLKFRQPFWKYLEKEQKVIRNANVNDMQNTMHHHSPCRHSINVTSPIQRYRFPSKIQFNSRQT